MACPRRYHSEQSNVGKSGGFDTRIMIYQHFAVAIHHVTIDGSYGMYVVILFVSWCCISMVLLCLSLFLHHTFHCIFDFLQCAEDIYLDYQPQLKEALLWLNVIFAVLFTVEMLLKWFGMGFKKYFTSFWCVLDFSIVIVSIKALQKVYKELR